MARSHSLRLLCCLALGLAGSAAPAAAQSRTMYDLAIDSYREGHPEEAWKILAKLDDAQVWAEANRFFQMPRDQPDQWLRRAQAAILMHTEAWFGQGRDGLGRWRVVHYDAARAIARALARAVKDVGLSERGRVFVRDWYLLVVAYLHGQASYGQSRPLLSEARDMFPGDALILLASGTDREMPAIWSGYLQLYDASGSRTESQRINKERELSRAAEFFREALAVDPLLVEGHLRLGRTLYALQELKGAAGSLEMAKKLARLPSLVYLATLFLGLTESAAGRVEAAERQYEEAIAIYPQAQSAQIAMSELAYVTGRTDDAAVRMTVLLAADSKDDPYWTYGTGEFWHFWTRLPLLRLSARQ